VWLKWFLQIVDEISDEDRGKLQSVEILWADTRLFSRTDFQYTSLKWLQSFSAGNVKLHNSVVVML